MLQLSTLPPDQVAKFWHYYEAACSGQVPGVKLERPADQYNDIGSRYSIEHLQYIGVAILYLPIEIMATYACQQVVTGEAAHIYRGDSRLIFEKMNATSIGNIAHAALHSNCIETKEHANSLLRDFTKLFDAQVYQIAEKN